MKHQCWPSFVTTDDFYAGSTRQNYAMTSAGAAAEFAKELGIDPNICFGDDGGMLENFGISARFPNLSCDGHDG